MANVHGRAGREPMRLNEGRMANVHGLAGREPMMLLFELALVNGFYTLMITMFSWYCIPLLNHFG